MSVIFKFSARLLAAARSDLHRAHPFAYERIGFLTAGASSLENGTLVLFGREYHPIEDNDYVKNPRVGAEIGPDAMRKGLQQAYRTRSALFHIHTHGGQGTPSFSSVDLADAPNFVPSFFNAVPAMPQGILVLSNNSACGLLWQAPTTAPNYIDGFVQIGAPLVKFGGCCDAP